MKGKSKIILKILTIVGLLSLGYYVILAAYLGFKIGFEMVWAALGVACFGISALLKAIGHKKQRAQAVIASIVAVGMALAVAVMGIGIGIVAAKRNEQPMPNAKYMIVLGARVKNSAPSRLLNFRIQAACDYLKKNENTIAILCGGQGSDEPISEAQAMYEGLVNRGIDPSRLILEEKSINTEQNIANAMAFIDDPSDSVVVTTSGYHVYRALQEARRAGLTNVSGNGSACAKITLLNYYVREVIALIRNWIFA